MTENNLKCPSCGKSKMPWFKLCFDCNEKESQKPTCEVCGIAVPEGHYLCKLHWSEKQAQKQDITKINYVKTKKESEFKEKFEGKFYFNSQKVKSKSELLICYFLSANKVIFSYEPIMNIPKEVRPDFVIEADGSSVILEHFGKDDEDYNQRRDEKIKMYEQFCKENKTFFFVKTNEDDMYNLKDRLGKKLNETPLKRAMWK